MHYNGENSYLFVNGTEIIKFKAKDSKIVAGPLCLGNISKDWSIDNMKRTGFTGYVYDFSVDYEATDVDDVKDTHKYLMKKNNIVQVKTFGFVKKVFVLGLTILSDITKALECVSMNNQACKVRPKTIYINSNNPIFYPFSVKISRCCGNCNKINDPYARICVPETVKNLNVKVFNLMSRTNETRSIEWHETCKCICRLNEIICNNKQRWNKDKCRCECKKLIDKEVCDKGYIFNPSNCTCKFDKSYKSYKTYKWGQ